MKVTYGNACCSLLFFFQSTSWASHPGGGFIYRCNYPVYLPYLLLLVVKLEGGRANSSAQDNHGFRCFGFAIYFN